MVPLAGDGRSDSSEHCALYGVYTMMDFDTSQVPGFELAKVTMAYIFMWLTYQGQQKAKYFLVFPLSTGLHSKWNL